MREISSIEKYVSYIMELKKRDEELGLGNYQWFFRGQKDSTWSIFPNVFRDDKLKSEYTTIQNAVRQNPFEFKQLTEFETLTKLQHYGLGTRLLDVTLNPLVALYFATEPAISYELGKDKRYKQVERDGIVFYKHGPWHSLNELCVRIAMVLPFIEFDESTTVRTLLNSMRQDLVINENELTFLEQEDCKYLIEYIQKSYFIVSSHSNDRLIRQSGAFVLPTAIKINKTSGVPILDQVIEKSHSSLNSEFSDDTLIIPSKYKAQIREQLDFFNINEATLFPELEHQMVYIQKKQPTITGSVPSFEPFVAERSADEQLDYNQHVPDVGKIIEDIVPNLQSKIKADMIEAISSMIAFIDWKYKEQIRSQIRLYVSRTLQKSLSARLSKQYAEAILELLLKPTEEYVKSEE